MLRKLGVVLGVFVMVAAACGTSDPPEESITTVLDDATVSIESGPSESGDDPPAEAATSTPVPSPVPSRVADAPDTQTMAGSSPIGAFFEEGGGFEAAIAEYTVKVEERLVICMAAQGFEFARTTPTVSEMNRLQSELTLLEWTTQFGYGISTSFDSIVQTESNDPNNEIIFELSPAERDLWILTLTGQEGFSGAADGPPPLEEQGCIGEALIATGGNEVIEGMESFGQAYDEGQEALFDRREMVDAVDAWSRCLSEAGYPDMAQRDDPNDFIQQEFELIIAPFQQALEGIDADEGRALFAGDNIELEDLPDLDVASLRKLQKDEIELALSDIGCYEQHVKATYEPLRDEFEGGLLTEYQGELEALRTIGQ